MMRSTFACFVFLMPCCLWADAYDSVIHDGHVHYDQDVWQALPAGQAIDLLKSENIQRALVSATPTEGAEKLYREDPQLVIPFLRPYKNWRHRYTWFKDADLKHYLLSHLDRVPYRGLGEFHISGKDVNSPAVDQMIELAREHKLALHPHIDLEGMKYLLDKASDLVVIWAHGGFDVPIDTLRQLMDKYPGLYIELSFRDGLLDEDARLVPEWRELLTNYHSRFLTGVDTYKPSRWAELPDTIERYRNWLGQLPDQVANDIAHNNLDRLFP